MTKLEHGHTIEKAKLATPEGLLYSWRLNPETPRADAATVVILHGAGQSNSQRFMSLAHYFADSGVGAIALDFLGHGKTGGKLADNSLALRTQHAMLAIKHWAPQSSPLILCGSSMSGHTALQLSELLGTRVKSLCLLQPAIYAAAAENISFTEQFTNILRTPESWRSSLALKSAARFQGRVFLGIGSEDAVIPWGVIEALLNALKQHSTAVRLDVVGGVGHEMYSWLADHPAAGRQLVQYLLQDLDE